MFCRNPDAFLARYSPRRRYVWLQDTAHRSDPRAPELAVMPSACTPCFPRRLLGSLVLLKVNPPFTALMVWRGVTATK
jgi:hypothetical protein